MAVTWKRIAYQDELHTQNTDTALGVLGTKATPVDADKVVQRNSAASDALVTSTWTQIKAFLKTYFDTLYNKYVHPNHSGEVTSDADGSQTIANSAVTQAKMADNAIGQAELKIGQDSVAVLGTQANITLPGGEYGFYPQIKSSSVAVSAEPLASIAGSDNTNASKSYITNIFLGNEDGGHLGYAQQNYVTASGEIHWVFILRDKITKGIKAMSQSSEHPCFGNGGKPLLVPHPFGGYDSEKYEIIVINPSMEEVEEILLNVKLTMNLNLTRTFLILSLKITKLTNSQILHGRQKK